MVNSKPYLMHWGVKGMRWGIRKSRSTSTDHATASSLKKKHISEMSNDDLAKITKRMQLERSYKDLRAKDVNAGVQLAGKIIGGAVTSVGTIAATVALKYAITKAIKKYKGG